MRAADSRHIATDALRYIDENYRKPQGVHACIGYAWSALKAIADQRDRVAPWDDPKPQVKP